MLTEGIRRVEMKVCGLFGRARERWRHIGRRRIRTMTKLDESKVRWIIRQKAKGELTNAQIAETQGISVIWVKKLWARYGHLKDDAGQIMYPRKIGRPANGMPGRREHSAILSASSDRCRGAVGSKATRQWIILN